MFGGPVEYNNGFLLHSKEYQIKNTTLKINEHFSLTNDTKQFLMYIKEGPCFQPFYARLRWMVSRSIERNNGRLLVANADPE